MAYLDYLQPRMELSREEENREFAPIWLGIIKRRGFYIMSRESLKESEQACTLFHHGGKSFSAWLVEKHLGMIDNGAKYVRVVPEYAVPLKEQFEIKPVLTYSSPNPMPIGGGRTAIIGEGEE
jgi:hypothetical protein